MKAVIQRVANASVTVDGEISGRIDSGLVILVGIENGDKEPEAEALAAKIAFLRIFTDDNDKMNLSVLDIGGSALVISNFTLCTDCRKGRRPNFSNAADPDTANSLYEYFCECLQKNGVNNIQKGVFGADMKVRLLNDGPVTIVMDSKDLAKH